MMRVLTWVVLPSLVACCVCGCVWKPPVPPALKGWTPLEIDIPDVEAWTRESAVILAHEPREQSGEAFEAELRASPGALVALRAGLPPGLEVSIGPLRKDRGISWVDAAFATDIPRRMRLAWFESEDGLREADLLAPASTWNSHIVSPFHEKLREYYRKYPPTRGPPKPPAKEEDPGH